MFGLSSGHDEDTGIPVGSLAAAGGILDGTLDALADLEPLPGVVVGVTTGEWEVVRARGLADLATGRELGPSTAVPVGSVSKVPLALRVLQLAGDGAVALDAPVNAQLRRMRVRPPLGCRRPVTVEQLLTHTSGLPSFYPWLDSAVPPGAPTPRVGAVYGRRVRAAGPPGREVVFSNHNYSVLSQLVEDVTGGRVEDEVARHVLGPLGLAATGYRRPAGGAVGYTWTGGEFEPVPAVDTALRGAEGLHSTAADLLRLGRALLAGGVAGDGRRVVGADAVRGMTSTRFSLDPPSPGFGWCLELKDLRGHRVAYQHGHGDEASCTLQVLPGDGLAVAVLTNTSVLRLLDVVTEVVLRRLLGLPAADPVPPRPGTCPPGVAGTYARDGRPVLWRAGQHFRVSADPGGPVLTVVAAETGLRTTVPLVRGSRPDPLAFALDPRALWGLGFGQGRVLCPATFRRDAGGAVSELVLQGTVAARRRRAAVDRFPRLDGALRRVAVALGRLPVRARLARRALPARLGRARPRGRRLRGAPLRGSARPGRGQGRRRGRSRPSAAAMSLTTG